MSLILGGCLGSGLSPGGSGGEDTGVAPLEGTIRGRVVAGESGLLLQRATATIEGVGDIPVENGVFSVAGLKPGRYTISVSSPYHRPAQKTVHVSERDVAVEVVMETVFTEQELYDLAAIVRAEAEGEPLVGQVAVAASILNRWASPAYPNNLTDIVYQVVDGYYQYSPVLDGRIELGPNEEAWEAAYRALAVEDPSLGATGFFAHDKVGSRSWVRQWPVTTVIANHTFFQY